MIYRRQELQIYSIHRHTTSINKIFKLKHDDAKTKAWHLLKLLEHYLKFFAFCSSNVHNSQVSFTLIKKMTFLHGRFKLEENRKQFGMTLFGRYVFR